jgi:hypothetical protein
LIGGRSTSRWRRPDRRHKANAERAWGGKNTS